jgi:hypothetical protein
MPRPSGYTPGQKPQAIYPAPQLVWLRLNLPFLPSPRIGFSMTLDTTDHTALLFGGYHPIIGSIEYPSELWSTDGHTWAQVPADFPPIGRIGANMVYDEMRQEAVLFGGFRDYEYFGDTWKITPGYWIQLAPQNSPPPRAFASMAYDVAHGETVLFGGATVHVGLNWNALNDTWTWDGVTWRQKFPASLPSLREDANMVYDSVHQNIVLFGGALVGGLFNDTWIWNGTNWVEQHPFHLPPQRADFGMAYDEDRQQVIVFGGQVGGDQSEGAQTWAWDGQDWTQLQTFINPPEGMIYPAQLVYLPGLHSIVLFGDNRQKFCTNYDCTSSDESEMWALNYEYLNYFPLINR